MQYNICILFFSTSSAVGSNKIKALVIGLFPRILRRFPKY